MISATDLQGNQLSLDPDSIIQIYWNGYVQNKGTIIAYVTGIQITDENTDDFVARTANLIPYVNFHISMGPGNVVPIWINVHQIISVHAGAPGVGTALGLSLPSGEIVVESYADVMAQILAVKARSSARG